MAKNFETRRVISEGGSDNTEELRGGGSGILSSLTVDFLCFLLLFFWGWYIIFTCGKRPMFSKRKIVRESSEKCEICWTLCWRKLGGFSPSFKWIKNSLKKIMIMCWSLSLTPFILSSIISSFVLSSSLIKYYPYSKFERLGMLEVFPHFEQTLENTEGNANRHEWFKWKRMLFVIVIKQWETWLLV